MTPVANPARPMINVCVKAKRIKTNKARHEAVPKIGRNRGYTLVSALNLKAAMLAIE